MSILVILLAIPAVAFVLTGYVRRYALVAQIVDIPNIRSSHDVVTPRGGGLAIVIVVLSTLPLFWFKEALPGNALISLAVGGAAVAAIGWWDDQGNVPASWRFLVHVTAAAFVIWQVRHLELLSQPTFAVAATLLTFPMLLLFIAWILNLFNFMDGIDGIAGVEAVTVAGVAGLLLWWAGEDSWALLSGIVALASLGFLAWNWPPAKVFMGDAGSGFLGFILAALAVLTWVETTMSILTWLILLGVFIVDATLTLLRRALHKEPLYQAHRSHAYQHAARRFGAHRPVTIAVLFINLFWLTPLAAAAARWPSWGLMHLAISWCPLAVIWWYFGAGLPEEKTSQV